MHRTRPLFIAVKPLGSVGLHPEYDHMVKSRSVRPPADPERTPYGAEHMKPGVTYAQSTPDTIAVFKRPVRGTPLTSSRGLTDRIVPHDLLNIEYAFSNVKAGEVTPQPYTMDIVEPISADPEKHPVVPLFWHHKWTPTPTPPSYGMDPLEVVSEGRDRNPWLPYRNPGLRFKKTYEMRRSIKKLAFPGKNKRWKWGHAHRKNSNPWWISASLANRVVEGRAMPERGIQPHFAYYKYLPILGWNGFGVKQGEIEVDSRYTEVPLDQIQWWVDAGMLNPNETITPGVLIESRMVEDYHWPGLKLTFNNCTWFKAKVDIDLEMAEPAAIKAVEEAGGSVVTRWRDSEAIAKEKCPWRFPVIQSAPLPPAELLRDVYANDDHRGYLSGFYERVLKANPQSPREWSLLRKSPQEIGEVPPEKIPQEAKPLERLPVQVSLLKKQQYWEDYLAGTASQPGSRLGLLTPKPLPIWEYTFYKKSGPGHIRKREAPAGSEVVTFPGYPLRDPLYYSFVEGKGPQTNQAAEKMKQAKVVDDPYKDTDMEVIKVDAKPIWELKGEGWRTEEDREVRYRNPYNNPYLKERIQKWQALQKRKEQIKKRGN
eukprot:TRINITY_DN12976_c0_g2_i1.p2 TRINITY_DN12976_c0_g2~~TRINITY_DN12976_c0_g2_i1.p2  ORF type:complete len:597 (+),score=176.32 TRINITY_DN12976_c0_g2_i1:101-1891(+)